MKRPVTEPLPPGLEDQHVKHWQLPLAGTDPVVVAYPSGRWALLTVGSLLIVDDPAHHGCKLPAWIAGSVTDQSAPIVLLDARAVVYGEAYEALWDPRDQTIDPELEADRIAHGWPPLREDGKIMVGLDPALGFDLMQAFDDPPEALVATHEARQRRWLVAHGLPDPDPALAPRTTELRPTRPSGPGRRRR